MKVLLVDDHALFLEGMKNFLEVNDIEVIGTAKSGLESVSKIKQLSPDLVIMDVQMTECDGIEATRMIKAEYPDMKVVMLTANEDKDSLIAALQAGAAGYLLKSMDPEQFLWQLKGLGQGELALAPGLAKQLLLELNRLNQTTEQNLTAASPLTARQTEILQLLTEGLTYREMAQRLDVKESTVKYHIKELLAKLQLANRTQLLAYAYRMGLTEKK